MDAQQLIATMREFRHRTLALVDDLDDGQMIGPRLAIVNPPLWEIGHVAWFQEFWALRHLRGAKPVMANADQFYNSSDVAHDTRWELLLPGREQTLSYMKAVLDRCIEHIDGKSELAAQEFYFYWLATFHEGMHAEALAYTRQTLGYAPPVVASNDSSSDLDPRAWPGDVEIPGGRFIIGADKNAPFVFDNEKWAHEVEIEPFRIARAPVTNGAFLEFVEAGGYRERRFWSDEGWQWLQSGGSPQLEKSFATFFNKTLNEPMGVNAFNERLDHPVYWKREAKGRWKQRV
ncbi:MAG TPA: SUMF1/EgtB/PvdO family nonheme iron enzyme [Candidatus Limnocylindria bacterium]|nr:SUMF1/EgtB/PvdO family nonheme iron enzyme [Candidatus Limnocylindria bacterium]